MQLLEVSSLNQARQIIQDIDYDIIITNPKDSTRYLGVLVIDHIFRTLMIEFNVIKSCIINTSGDSVAKYTAQKLGYCSKSQII